MCMWINLWDWLFIKSNQERVKTNICFIYMKLDSINDFAGEILLEY